MPDIGAISSVRPVLPMPSGDHVFKSAKEREAARLEREAEQAREQAAAAEQASALLTGAVPRQVRPPHLAR
jgi:hypothetical protein